VATQAKPALIYPVFCKYGCFKQRTMHAKLYVEKNSPAKLSLDIDLTKDSANVMTVAVNSRNNPYVFKIVAPRILPRILPTGRESIEFEADHSPGNYLRIKSNTNAISSFKIEKMDGETRRIELNGKELIKAGFTKGDNQITQTSTLPDGRSLTTTVSWETDSIKANKVHIKLDGTERNLDAHVEWDVTNAGAMVLKMNGKGQNARWGKYELTRDIKTSFTSSGINVDWKGDSSFQNSPWPSPVHTEITGNMDFNSNKFGMKMAKTVAGKTYALSVQDGKVNLEM
jgi:5-hydroxyisourate hydrolase-like protein (transthyretin family)